MPGRCQRAKTLAREKSAGERGLLAVKGSIVNTGAASKTNRVMVEGVPGLAWGEGRDCTFAGALVAALSVTEHTHEAGGGHGPRSPSDGAHPG